MIIFLSQDQMDLSIHSKYRKLLRFMLYFLAVALGTGFVVLIARASVARYFPGQCSGTWSNPEAAQVPVPDEAEVNITEANSAVLSGPTGSAITCAGFSVDKSPGRMLAATLNLVWAFRSPQESQEGASLLPSPLPTAITGETTDTAPGVQSDAPATAPFSSTEPESGINTSSETSSSNENAPIPVLPAPDNSSAAPDPVTESREFSSSTVPVESSGAPTSFFRLILPIARAQTVTEAPKVTASLVFNGLEHFLDVQYSLDGGANWKSVDNANLDLPLTNFDDIPKTQIRIVSLREGKDLPRVYLRAMYLEARYVPEANAEISNATSSVISTDASSTSLDTIATDTGLGQGEPTLLDALTNVATEAAQAVTDAIAGNTQPDTPQIDSGAVVSTVEAPPPAPELVFEQEGGTRDTSFLATLSKAVASPQNNAITISPDQLTLQIQGKCDFQYMTVMIFADEFDLEKDPARAVVNKANSCLGGQYSFKLDSKALPAGLSDGSYSVILAEQEDNSKPKPLDAYKIKITKKIIQ